jgi:hypothetical protein
MKIKIEKPDEAMLQDQGVRNWPIWECAPSTFDWHYDQTESCYILEGEIRVKTAEQEVAIGPGDFVTFPKGLDCTWIVAKAVRKHYSFS